VAVIVYIVLVIVSNIPHQPDRKHTRNPSGALGVELKLATQSMKVLVPLIANTTKFKSSSDALLTTKALAPVFTCISFSRPEGFL
jgi:hypothetical protein